MSWDLSIGQYDFKRRTGIPRPMADRNIASGVFAPVHVMLEGNVHADDRQGSDLIHRIKMNFAGKLLRVESKERLLRPEMLPPPYDSQSFAVVPQQRQSVIVRNTALNHSLTFWRRSCSNWEFNFRFTRDTSSEWQR